MDVTEFVSARIDFVSARLDEDETVADTPRVLREVAAKRAILADCQRAMSKQAEFNAAHARYGTPFPSPHANLAFRTALQLATVWSDHPDYRGEQAPES